MLKTGHKQLLHGATVSTIYLASWTWFNEHLCKSRREPHPVVAILSGRRHSVMHSGADSRWCKPLVNHSELSGCLSMCACVVCIALRGVSEAGQTLSIPCVGSPSNYTRRTLAHKHTHSHTLTLWHFWVAIRRKKMLCLKAIFTLCCDFCFQFLGMDQWMTSYRTRPRGIDQGMRYRHAKSIAPHQFCNNATVDTTNAADFPPSLSLPLPPFPSWRRDKLLWLTMKQLSGLPIRPIGSSNLGSVVLRLPLLGFYFISLCCFVSFLLLLLYCLFAYWFGTLERFFCVFSCGLAREINWKMHLMIFQICFQPHA